MGLVSGFVVFVIIWWLVFFMVLPWGVNRTENPEAGHDTGAPDKPMLVRKVLATTAISVILFGLFYLLEQSGVISLKYLAARFNIY